MSTQSRQQSYYSFIYLALVPFITAITGFAIGGYSNAINIPIWLIHAAIMIFLFRNIAMPLRGDENGVGQKWIAIAVLLFAPWVLFTLFAGFGPPPSSVEKWVASATQQQVRYFILALGGMIATAGFTLLSQQLNNTDAANIYAKAAIALVYAAIPLYVLNMLYWGFYLTESFRLFENSGTTVRPDWYFAARQFFYWIGTFGTAFIYLSIALFAGALKKASVFKPGACHIYIVVSLVAFVCSFIPPSAPTPMDVIGYFVAIPAIAFIIPYLFALNLARIGTKPK